MGGLALAPIRRDEARAFVAAHHRHNGPPLGWLFGCALLDEHGTVVAVAMAGRPVAKAYDDGRTVEVTRVCTLEQRNAASRLYGAVCRAAQALGYRRAITYNLATEGGASLRAARLHPRRGPASALEHGLGRARPRPLRPEPVGRAGAARGPTQPMGARAVTIDTAALWETGLPPAAAGEFQPGNLATKFLQPPFTVLDTRQGSWQERRRAWLSLGLRSELGRGAQAFTTGAEREGGMVATMAKGLLSKATERTGFGADYDTSKGENAWGGSGTSIFDPVLCELAYRWFAPPGGTVLDPFAGGSVRGIVAAKLGHPYTGIDLSGPQLAANAEQADLILAPSEPRPHWIRGDSAQLENLLPAGELYDMVWTCPPYFDLEVYSDDPADLSAMEWPGFVDVYQQVIAAACQRLRRERFAAIVVSEVRDPTGSYRGLVPLTIHAFQLAGLRFYNEAVLVNSAGSLPLRVTKYMEASRKLGRAHQNVLVFLKGDPPRGWSYDRAAPPSPQLDLALLVEPEAVPAPSPSPLPAPAAIEDAGALSGATEDEAQQRPNLEGMSPPEPFRLPDQPAPTRCEDHEDGYHLTQGEADECSAETYGEVGWDAGEPVTVLEYPQPGLGTGQLADVPEPVAAGDTVDHPDGYLVDGTTGEVLEYPQAVLEVDPVPAVAELHAAAAAGLCKHEPGFHRGALEASACRIGGWWPGWPSVIEPGPPGSGATAAPPAPPAPTLWQPSDDSEED